MNSFTNRNIVDKPNRKFEMLETLHVSNIILKLLERKWKANLSISCVSRSKELRAVRREELKIVYEERGTIGEGGWSRLTCRYASINTQRFHRLLA